MTAAPPPNARGVVVVGASSAIGRAIADRFLANGDQVIGVSLADTKGTLDFAHYVADCSDPAVVRDVIRRAASELGGNIDVVVPGAAVTPRARAEDTTDSQWETTLASTLSSAFYVCRESLPFIPRGGCIVMVSSIVAVLASPGIVAYAAAKGAINSMVRVLALESGGSGIRVNAVAPGLIGGTSLDRAADGYPLRRTGTPEEVAGVVAFLASSDASFITGVVLPVDGGLTAGSAAVYQRPDLLALLDASQAALKNPQPT